MKFKAACVQINSQNDMQANLEKSMEMIRQAADKGADLITLPENVAFMGANYDELKANSYTADEHPAIAAFQAIAIDTKKWLLVGSVAVKIEGQDKLVNRSFLINDKGQVFANYDKIHMYDASVKGGETHRESDRFLSGENAVMAQTPFGMLAMTICYDLRFPYLYRTLAQQGAEILAVPSSFTKFTGEAHWHTLLRARAIENGCYVIAPAQTGNHPAGRKTYGHSLIIDPWGEIIAEAGEKEEVIIAEIDLSMIEEVRTQIASLYHDREFGGVLFN